MEGFSEKAAEELLPTEWFPAEVATTPDPVAGRRAAIYSRYSFLGKRESSIERQNEICTNYINSNNYVLVATYEDRARTGTIIVGREQLQQCLEDAAEKRFDILVVEDIDRLGRALEVTVEIWNELKKLGVEIHDTEIGKLTPGQIGAKAGASHEERTKIVKRARQGQRRKVRQGEWSGNNCFGYQRVLLDPKRAKTAFVKHPKEAAIVREIFELFDKGVSCDRIAEILNRRPAEDRGNRLWTGHKLRGSGKFGYGILRRLRYAGLSIHGRNTTTKTGGKYKVTANPRNTWAVGQLDTSLIIIKRDLFQRVQDRLNRDKTVPRPPTWTVKHYPLGGLLFCASCGGKMTPTLKRKDGTPRAMCNRARNPKSIVPGSKRCDNRRSTSIDQIDDMVRQFICTEVAHPAVFEAFVHEYNVRRQALSAADDRERPELQRTVSELKAERDDLWKNRHTFGDDFIDEKAVDLTARIDSAKAKLNVLEAAPNGNLKFERNATASLAPEFQTVFAPGFDAKSATGAKVVAALRKLVAKIIVDLTDDNSSIEIHCNVAAVVAKGGTAEVVKFYSSRPRTGHSPLHSELRRIDALVQAKTHALTDQEWGQIAPLIPACVVRSKRGTAPADPRKVIDAALLHLHEGVPLARMPAAFGERRAIFEGLRRLSSSGAWDVAVDVLRKIAPHRVPAKSSNMFCTVKGRYSTSLKGLPEIRARHSIEMDAGKHALTDEEWELVADLVPEQVLTVQMEPARITPRDFLHGIFYMLKTGTPISHMPLRVGSETYFSFSIRRLVNHGYWDQILERLVERSPNTLASADLSRFDLHPRSPRQRPIWRRSLAKAADMSGVPNHAPNEYEWGLIRHLFPLELLYVEDKLAINNPRLLAHAILYRVKEKIPYTAFPPYFGDAYHLQLTITKFVFHHLWEEMVTVLLEKSPETLKNADLKVFSRYKRGRTRRYAHLLPAVEPAIPPHAPSDAQWALAEDLIPPSILVVRGKPAIMEPREFLHAIFYMVTERVQFGGLPKSYFGSIDDIRFVMRKFVRHHLWDTMVTRFSHFDSEWAAKVDLTMFDKLARSTNENPDFRQHRVRRSKTAPSPREEGRIAENEALDGNASHRSLAHAP